MENGFGGSMLSRMIFSNSNLIRTASSVLIALALAVVVPRAQTGTHPVSGRVYALPMGVQGASWLDRPERVRGGGPGSCRAAASHCSRRHRRGHRRGVRLLHREVG